MNPFPGATVPELIKQLPDTLPVALKKLVTFRLPANVPEVFANALLALV